MSWGINYRCKKCKRPIAKANVNGVCRICRIKKVGSYHAITYNKNKKEDLKNEM